MTSRPARLTRATSATSTASAIGYVRVSTAEQDLGLEAQRAAIAAYAERQGLTLAHVYADEGICGAAPLSDRVGLLDALDALTPGSVLIVARLDRLSRGDAIEAAIIENLTSRKRARIVSTNGEGTQDDGPASMLTRQLLQAIASYERALISARTRAALRAKIAKGEQAGTPRFGSTPQEQDALQLLSERYQAGASLIAIATELNARGFTTRSGQPWRWEYVRGVVRTQTGTRPSINAAKRQRATRAALQLAQQGSSTGMPRQEKRS